jgi:hypothetical protein
MGPKTRNFRPNRHELAVYRAQDARLSTEPARVDALPAGSRPIPDHDGTRWPPVPAAVAVVTAERHRATAPLALDWTSQVRQP